MASREVIGLPAIVEGAQVLSSISWLFVTFHCFPALVRALNKFFGRLDLLRPWDAAECSAALMGITQMAFNIRWLLLGRDDISTMSRTTLILWAPLYIMNAACAISILHTWRDQSTDNVSFETMSKRVSTAVAAWITLAFVCVGAASWNL